MPEDTPILWAIAADNEELALKRIAAGCDPDYIDPKRKMSALHAASHIGSENLVKALINAGANVNVLNGDRNTPLHEAAHRRVARLLIQAGGTTAPVDNPDLYEKTNPPIWPEYDLSKMLSADDLIESLGLLLCDFFRLTNGERFIHNIYWAYYVMDPNRNRFDVASYEIDYSLGAHEALQVTGAHAGAEKLEPILRLICEDDLSRIDQFRRDETLINPTPATQELRQQFCATRPEVDRQLRIYITQNPTDFI